MRRNNPTGEDQLIRYVWRIVAKSVRNKQDREDVVHDAVAEFYATFDPDKSTRWQTQAGFAAQHAVRDYFRRRSGLRYVPQEYQGSITVPYEERLPPGPRGEVTEPTSRMPYTRPSQESALETQELLGHVSRLTPKEQTILEQHLQGYSWKEIAQDLGVSPQAVQQVKDRAMKKLREARPNPMEIVATKEEWAQGNPGRPYTNYDGLEVRLALVRAPNYDAHNRPSARSTNDLAKLLSDNLSDDHVESVLSVVVNSKLNVLGIYVAARGEEDSVQVNPLDLLRPVIAAGASRFIVVHNHPADTPEPSDADLELTAHLAEVADLLGIKLIDHVIVGSGEWYSMDDEYGDAFPWEL